jgi:hypothetical protein
MAEPQKPAGDKPRNFDYRKVGPTSIEGVEASDLPDKGRGPVETDFGKEAGRNLPQQTGEDSMGQTGLRAEGDIVEADARGGRKHN